MPKNDRLLKVHFASIQSKLTIIAAYTPTYKADNSTKDAFHFDLNELVNSVPEYDILVLCGDFDPKVGSDRFYEPEMVSRHCLCISVTSNQVAYL